MTQDLLHPSRRGLLRGLGAAALAGLPAASVLGAMADHAAAEGLSATGTGTLVFGIPTEPPTLTPFWTPDTQASTISTKVVDGLLTYDRDFNPVPQLATAWEVSEDGTQYTFRLREGVRWHDGQPFTARDVEHSLKLAAKWHTRARITLAKITEYVLPDDHTIILKLSAPAPYLLVGLLPAEVPILPTHLFTDDSVEPVKNPVNFAPVGTGPFRFETWERGSSITLVRNEDYWGDRTGNLDRIIFRIIPDAQSTMVALETKEIDIAAVNPIPIVDLDRIGDYPHLDVNWDGYTYRPSPYWIEFNLSNPNLSDLRARQAIAHAIDVPKIIDLVFFGHAVQHWTPVSPDSKGYFLDVPGYPHDIDRANALLDEAGLPRGADGTRFSLRFRHAGDRTEFGPVADFIQASLRQVGIRLEIQVQKGAVWNPLYDSGDWDSHLNIATNMIDPALGVTRWYKTRDPNSKVKSQNSGYSSPEVDRLLDEALAANNEAERFALWHRIQEIVVRDLPRIVLFSEKNFTVYNRRVSHFASSIDGVRSSYADTSVKG